MGHRRGGEGARLERPQCHSYIADTDRTSQTGTDAARRLFQLCGRVFVIGEDSDPETWRRLLRRWATADLGKRIRLCDAAICESLEPDSADAWDELRQVATGDDVLELRDLVAVADYVARVSGATLPPGFRWWLEPIAGRTFGLFADERMPRGCVGGVRSTYRPARGPRSRRRRSVIRRARPPGRQSDDNGPEHHRDERVGRRRTVLGGRR